MLKRLLLGLVTFTVFIGNTQPGIMRAYHWGMNENKVDIITGSGVFFVPAMLYIPKVYFDSPSKKLPVIFYFHGAGTAGSDTIKLLNADVMKKLNNGATPTTYVNESGTSYHPSATWTLGGQRPYAVIAGDTIEPIIVAGQHGSWSLNCYAFSGMFEDATARLFPGRVDSTRIYLLGLSAGVLGTLGTFSGQPGFPTAPDTAYLKYVSAIIIDQPATQDLCLGACAQGDGSTAPGLRSIGVRQIPTFILDGLNDIGYRDRARQARDSINVIGPPSAILEEIEGEGHCCFEDHADSSKNYAAAGAVGKPG